MKAVPLEDLYTAVKILDTSEMMFFSSDLQEMEKSQRELKQRRLFAASWDQPEIKTGMEVANNSQFLMVLGAPGSRKSTFLRKVGLEAFSGPSENYKHRCLPVFLELKGFKSAEVEVETIEARIAEQFEICGFPKPDDFMQSSLQQGRLLVLFDGLDEVPNDNVANVVSAIRNFVVKYDKNRFVASCRTAAYQNDFKSFENVCIADFDDEQIQQFINNWFSAQKDRDANTATECWSLLNSDTHKASKELAQTPLLLAFLCMVYDRSLTFPDNRATLYQDALRILLKDWAAEKRLPDRETVYKDLPIDKGEQLLSEIA